MLKKIDARLARIGTDYLDLLFFLGQSTAQTDWPRSKEMKDAVEAIKKTGKVMFVGFSTHDPMIAEQIHNAAKGGFIDVVMLKFSPWLGNDEPLYKALDAAHKANIGLVSMKQTGGQALKITEERVPSLKARKVTLAPACRRALASRSPVGFRIARPAGMPCARISRSLSLPALGLRSMRKPDGSRAGCGVWTSAGTVASRSGLAGGLAGGPRGRGEGSTGGGPAPAGRRGVPSPDRPRLDRSHVRDADDRAGAAHPQVSQIEAGIQPGRRVVKGEELGYFQYGGSTYCMVFRPGAIAEFALEAIPEHHSSASLVLVGSRLARAR
jgi:hypothetical protein